MTSVFMIASVLEVGLVVAAAVLFVALVVTVLAMIIWSVAGFISATHQDPAAHR